MSLRRAVPILLLVAALSLTGLQRCSEFSVRGGCNGPEGEETSEEEVPTGGGGGVPSSKSYTFKRGEIGTTYNTGSSESKDYRASTQLGWFLSEGVTLSDSYQTFHPMSQEILKRPPTLRVDEAESLLPEEDTPP